MKTRISILTVSVLLFAGLAWAQFMPGPMGGGGGFGAMGGGGGFGMPMDPMGMMGGMMGGGFGAIGGFGGGPAQIPGAFVPQGPWGVGPGAFAPQGPWGGGPGPLLPRGGFGGGGGGCM